MASDAMREEFEAWATTILGDNPTWRGSGDCELAWQAWQAARRTPAAEVAGSSGSSMPVVAWVFHGDDKDGPHARTPRVSLTKPTGSWPIRHELVLQSDALKAIEGARAEALEEAAGLASSFSDDYMVQAREGDTSGASDHKACAAVEIADAIRSLKESPSVRAASSLDERGGR